MADGSVEVRITGSVDPSLAASANEAKAAIVGVADSTNVSAKEMAAALAATGGNLKAITPEMLGLGVTSAQTGQQIGKTVYTMEQFTAASKGAAAAAVASAAASSGDAAAQAADTVATETNTAAHISSRAAYESLVLVHEALQGRFSRMAGSSMILTQQLAGQAAVSKFVTAAMSAQGLAIIGTVAAIGLATAATISYESEEKKLTETAVGLGAQSGLTADQLKKIGESADSSSQSIRETTKAAEAFAAAGVKDEGTVKALSNSIEAYSQLTGVKFAAAQKKLAEAMKDPIKGAKDLHDELGILDGAQLEEIERLVALGDKTSAQIVITQAYIERIREAKQAGADLTSGFGELINVLSNVYNWVGNVSTAFGREAETIAETLIPGLHQLAQAHRDAAAAAQHQIDEETQLNIASAKGTKVYDKTPEGQLKQAILERKGALDDARAALAADTRLYGEHSEKVAEDKVALDSASHALQTYRSEIQKKTAADALDVKIAEARHAHNKQLVADLTEQKALLEESGKYETDAQAKALAKGAGDVAGAKTFAPKGRTKGPDIVSEWEEQLHAAEIASDDFFHDQTQKELEFWEAKVGETRKGSKDWLAVQSKIYEAQKALAHKDYDEHIADLNDRLEADRNNFKKFQADWVEKLAFIKSKNGEESTAYKDAHRQMEAEMRQHQDQMLREELAGQSKAVSALKESLKQQEQLRSTYAKEAEEIIKEEANNSVLGEATAAARIGEIHLQLAQQRIADAVSVFQQEDELRQDGLRKALAAWGEEDERYKNAKQDELNATRAFYSQIELMQAQAAEQQIQDIVAVKNAYAGYVSGTVNAAVAGLDGMLSKTESWKQALIGVYQSLVQTLEGALQKWATNWIVTHVFMSAAQRQQLALQNAQHAASEATKTASTTTGTAVRTGVAAAGTAKTTALETTSTTVHAGAETAKTGATTAGVTTRAAVENSGFFAKLLALLGISVGHHVGSEAAKTAATTTGATTRAAAEDTAAATSAATQTAANVALVSSYAGVAGAAGTASFAAAPWPVDMGAPAFGASMSAAALGYLSLASLDVGTNYLPNDMVVQAHEGERVIPKADNRQLMQLLAIGANGGSDAGRGDVHLHYQPHIHERERLSLRQLLANGGGDMIAFLNQAVRDGKLKLKPA